LFFIAEGKTSREIAEVLLISPRTVEHHRGSISEKLGLSGTNALVKFAATHKSQLS
jgi:DNA-binding CsgD family transcriptional regulator